MGVHASLVFHYTGLDISEMSVDKAARCIAMNRRAMLVLKLMEEKVVPKNGITGKMQK